MSSQDTSKFGRRISTGLLNIKKRLILLYLNKKTKRFADVPNILLDALKINMVETSKFVGTVINSSLIE